MIININIKDNTIDVPINGQFSFSQQGFLKVLSLFTKNNDSLKELKATSIMDNKIKTTPDIKLTIFNS